MAVDFVVEPGWLDEHRHGSTFDLVRALFGLMDPGFPVPPLMVVNEVLGWGEWREQRTVTWAGYVIDDREYAMLVTELVECGQGFIELDAPSWVTSRHGYLFWGAEVADGLPADLHRSVNETFFALHDQAVRAGVNGFDDISPLARELKRATQTRARFRRLYSTRGQRRGAGVSLVGRIWDLSGKYEPDQDWFGCQFARADFSDADVRATRFTLADLTDVTFRGADVAGCRFEWADLRAADFRGCKGIADAWFADALADDETLWPDGFDPVAAGVTFTDEPIPYRLGPRTDK